MGFWKRVLPALPLLLLSPFFLLLALLALAGTDLLWMAWGRKRERTSSRPPAEAATVVIPNWNGRDLLERYLPSVEAALADNPRNDLLVVDNGSTDGSAAFLRERFPRVRVLALPRNVGFGGGSNAGFRAATHRIVVLLNSDMRVEPDFLQPLLDGFTDEKVFAVSCQIFLNDRTKRREETGLTEGRWQDGALRVGHRQDDEIRCLFPCFYGGGGSCAFDRDKLVELGGFDDLLRPFYLEDADLGYMAWKRGWKVLYQPGSVVHHEHRGTIGKRFSEAYIHNVLKKNFILFAWKNIHEWRKLVESFAWGYAGALLSLALGDEPGRATLGGWARAFLQLPAALRSRWRARSLARISDTEAFRRPRGGYFRDRFLAPRALPEHPRVLFVSPYPICPPVHGGGVFMLGTLRELSRWGEVHAVVMLDWARERASHEELRRFCASAEFYVRAAGHPPGLGSVAPFAVREFDIPDVHWLIDRQILLHEIDVIQLEYTALGQYAEPYRNLATVLFEHDIYFQSVARGLAFMRPTERWKARWEYLRALRYELRMLPRSDRVQVCTRENREYVESFLPRLKGRVQEGLRAGIVTCNYVYPGGPRRPRTMLFLGSFRHAPNGVALEWLLTRVLPTVVGSCPDAKLLVAGSDPPPRHAYYDPRGAIEMLGFVPDIAPLLAEAAVFVCPIRSGSGVRVKLLEAFASGIPVVSTRLGAEGLARTPGEFCRLADEPEEFAHCILDLFERPEEGAAMAARARAEVERNWDMGVITRRLAASYREVLRNKRGLTASARED